VQWATGNPGYNSYDGYHAYVFDWQPGYVRWYIDGRLIDEMTAASYSMPQEWQMVTFSMW
jgi:endo-1,3-1,4-beta-glycanase ExoK